ncbi:eCIS core domain-containing protein [Flavobacterium tistrianum]|uniref:eCIS core domain-containing protein n=1 Tax=Flavobacterium tistrianum TaxID=1685414 RepID=UPI000DAE6B50|nr:DUF4157 domain-containing protein [Flavobacterium tistrianum]KAF2341833.1 DUF4157 domain-containing protein [Flavobacterium tistrianum]
MENSYEKAKTSFVASSLNEKPIQNKAMALQDNRPASILQRKANNTGLPDNLKSGIENLSGHSMDDVKVHYNSDKPAQLNAHAYAQGSDIHIASGQEKHLPHEAWHVVQQKQGRVKPTLQMKGKVNVNDDKGLENEADIMGQKALLTQNSHNVIQQMNSQNNNSLTGTSNTNKIIQRKIGPDGDGKLVTAPAFKIYMAKKNEDGTYDMYDESGRFFKQARISADDERYNIYNPEEVEDSEDNEKSFSSDEYSSSGESSSSNSSTNSDSSSSSDNDSSGSDDDSSVFDDEQNDDHNIVMHDLDSDEHKRLIRILKQGIFNAIGEGLNPRYIRSDKNKLIQLIGDKFGSKENKLGLLPDLFKGINAEILDEVISEIVKEISVGMQEEDSGPKKIKSIDEYITIQREISGSIKELFQSPTGNIELIHDGNYPPLIIHFPILRKFIIDHQERQSLKGKKIRAGQAKGMTKLLSARLMSLYNQNRGGNLPRLVEKSSFGFQIATLADLGPNLSIRLSPGINKNISIIIAKALSIIDSELQQLIQDESEFEFKDKVAKTDQLYKYWKTGKKTKEVSPSTLMKSYNKKKTLLKHLVFTQIETGSKGLSMIGQVLERNHDNIMFFAEQDATLGQMARKIFKQSKKLKLHANINTNIHGKITGISSPNLDPDYDKRVQERDEIGDELLEERIAIFQHILSTLKDDVDFDDDPVSSSDYEDEIADNQKPINIKTGKVVVPSGMAALSQLLTEDDRVSLKAERTKLKRQHKNKKANRKSLSDQDLEKIAAKIKELEEEIAQRGKPNKSVMKAMIPGDSSVYYEDHDVIDIMHGSGIKGYKPKDIIMLDINPNITQSSTIKISFNSELAKLTKSKKSVWVVDLTSSTSKEQEQVYLKWKSTKASTLLVTRVSGIKQQEGGQNMNPHGLIHWAHKTDQKDGHEVVQGFFADLQKKFPRSSISNEIRRFFKKEMKSYSWQRLDIKKGKTASTISDSSDSDDDGYSSGDERKDSKKRKNRDIKKDSKEKRTGSEKRDNRPEGRQDEMETPDLWYYDPIGDVAINPEAIPLFKEAYSQDVATSSAYLTEGEGHTLATQLGIGLTILEGQVDPEEYHIIQNSGSGDCLIHTLDTARSILSGQLSQDIDHHDSTRTKVLRGLIAQNIDDTSLETLISAAVFGNEPGLGPRMRSLINIARRTEKKFPPKKVKAKKSSASSSAQGNIAPVVQLPQLGTVAPSTEIFANHVGIHWQLVVKKKITPEMKNNLKIAIQKELGNSHVIDEHLFNYSLKKSSSLSDALFLYTDILESMQ